MVTSAVKINPNTSGIYNIGLQSNVKVIGSILPNGRNLCTKEAEMNGYELPRYGVILFGISHLEIDKVIYQIDSYKGIPRFRSLYESQYGNLNYTISKMRLIFEMSVQYDTNVETKPYKLSSRAWDCMLKYLKPESSWVKELEEGKDYSLELIYMPRPLRNKKGNKCKGFRFNNKNKSRQDTPVSVVFKQYARSVRNCLQVDKSNILANNSLCPSTALAMLTGEDIS